MLIVRGTKSCRPCIRSQDLLVKNGVPFIFYDVEKNKDYNYSLVPVTEWVENETSVHKIVGELEQSDIETIKSWIK